MRITNIEIENFRGIKKTNISFPTNSRIICMIGSGDSTKSTILRAIEWAVWPSWNLNIVDNDFFDSDVSNNIVIRITFCDIPVQLMSENKFGLYLRKPGSELREGVDDEPIEGEDICLTIQFTANDSLEPKWEVVCNRLEPKSISNVDRKKLSVSVVGDDCEKDLVWGRDSILQKYADAKDTLQNAYSTALRKISDDADLSNLDVVVDSINDIGKKYGVALGEDIKNRLIMHSGSFSSTVGLYDGNSPLSQRGTGSKRLLSMGLNISYSSGDSVLLIDEIESGLEPYRLRALIDELRDSHKTNGQVIMTTHSPIVVSECIINELCIVQSNNGITSLYILETADDELNGKIQAQVRKNAEAFLSKRLVVCEGKTEIGFLKAIEKYIYDIFEFRSSYKGVGLADGGGNSTLNFATLFRNFGYDVCVFMDSDLDDELQKSEVRKKYGIPIFDWDKDNSLEEQIFSDVSCETVNNLLDLAVKEKGVESVKAKITEKIDCFVVDDEKIHIKDDISDYRFIGTIAKKNNWYKRVDLGCKIGTIVISDLQNISAKSKLYKTISNIINWIKNYD